MASFPISDNLTAIVAIDVGYYCSSYACNDFAEKIMRRPIIALRVWLGQMSWRTWSIYTLTVIRKQYISSGTQRMLTFGSLAETTFAGLLNKCINQTQSFLQMTRVMRSVVGATVQYGGCVWKLRLGFLNWVRGPISSSSQIPAQPISSPTQTTIPWFCTTQGLVLKNCKGIFIIEV